MHNPFVTIIALTLLFFLVRAAWNVHRSAASASVRLSQAKAEQSKLEAEQKDLSVKIDGLSTPSGLESELRTKYRAVKEGESVAVIINSNQATTSSTAPSGQSTVSQPSANLWDRTLEFFGL